MAGIKGITVTLINEIESGKDGFGKPVYTEKRESVENVLVAPASVQEMTDTLNTIGKKAVYNIAIPKEDNHVWKDQKVEFFNQVWQVIGFPQRGIDDNIPLEWNEKWMVAAYE